MPVYFILGFFSLLTQVFILKELSGLLTAHEAALGLGLSAWLLWTAAGLALVLKNPALEKRLAPHFGRVLPGKSAGLAGPNGLLTACVCFTLAAGANLILFRHAGFLLKPGLRPGLLELILFSFLLTLPAALANGACIARGLSEKRLAFYRSETFGAAAGGLFTLLQAVFFPGADPLLMTGAAALALILSVPGISLKSVRKLAPAVLVGIVFFCGSRLSPSFTLPALFNNAAARVRTIGSRLAFLESPSQKTFIEDGAVLIQLPLTEQAEVSVQLAMLAHKKPEDILFTGPAGLFLAAEARKHKPTSITVSDPDRFRTEFIMGRSGVKPEGVRLERADARALLKARHGAWDIIFQTVPEPLNAAANRFFTLEFFRAAQSALKPGGMLTFTLPFSENYLPPERAYFAASILAGVGAAFKHVELAPGGTLTVFASDSPIDLAPETLARRYAQRKITNLYAVPANLPFLLDPYRRQWAAAMLANVKKAPLNTDLDPVAYFYLWKMWLAMFVSPATLSGLALLAVVFVLLGARLLKAGELLAWGKPLQRCPPVAQSPGRGAAKDAAGVFLAGFWAMGFETVCLFMFQTYSGQLSWKLGTLFSAFMAGSAAGVYALQIASRSRVRAAALVSALALTAWLYVYAPDLGDMAPAELFALFMVLLLAGGSSLGAYFAAAAGPGNDKTGRLYYSDLLGAALGGFIFSAALIPLAGLRAALLWSAGALIAGALVLVGDRCLELSRSRLLERHRF